MSNNVNCDNGELYNSYVLDNYDPPKNNKEKCGKKLSDESKETVKYFTDLFRLNQFDILEGDKNKHIAVESNKRDLPLVYKGKEDLFYFKPLRKTDYITQRRPVLKLKRKDKTFKKEPDIVNRLNRNRIFNEFEKREYVTDNTPYYIALSLVVLLVIIISILLIVYK
tara:strand:+ start:35 stop:535 length:501 start_codon:yes stop_codon:yes gene_type:complete